MPFGRTIGSLVGVPLVGTPYEVRGWQVSVVLLCKCQEPGYPLLVSSHAVTPCPGCQKGYVVQGAQVVEGRPPGFNVGILRPDAGDGSAK